MFALNKVCWALVFADTIPFLFRKTFMKLLFFLGIGTFRSKVSKTYPSISVDIQTAIHRGKRLSAKKKILILMKRHQIFTLCVHNFKLANVSTFYRIVCNISDVAFRFNPFIQSFILSKLRDCKKNCFPWNLFLQNEHIPQINLLRGFYGLYTYTASAKNTHHSPVQYILIKFRM